MPDFKDMTRRGRRRFLRRKARKFGYQPPDMPKKLTPKRTRKAFRQMKRQYWDTGDWATQPLTRRTALAEARASADLKYKPALREFRNELQQSKQQHKTIDLGFDLYTKKLQDIQNRANQLYTGATGQVFNQANTMAGQEATQRAQMDAQAQASADVRGATAAPSTESQQASRARQIFGTSFGGMLAAQGASHGTRLLDEERVGERQRISEHARELAYARKVKQGMRDTKADRRDLVRQYPGEQRELERRYGLERKAFGLERQAQKAEIRNARRDDKRALIEAYLDAKNEKRDDLRDRIMDRFDMSDKTFDNQVAAAKLRLDQQKANEPDAKKDRGERSYGFKGNFTRDEMRGNREELRKLQALIRGRLDKIGTDYQGAMNELIEKGNDPLLAKVAMDLVTKGYTDAGHAKDFRRAYGFSVKVG